MYRRPVKSRGRRFDRLYTGRGRKSARYSQLGSIMSNEEFQPCSMRQQLTQFAKDGTKTKIQRCTEQTAPHYRETVTPPDCVGCPVRVLVTKAAIQSHSYKPPLVKDLTAVHGTKPDIDPPKPWKPCKDRKIATVSSCCGADQELRICDSVECFRIGSAVSPEICSSCLYRGEGDEAEKG